MLLKCKTDSSRIHETTHLRDIKSGQSNGFSLLTVLFSLIVLTVLFTTAQQNYLSNTHTLKAILLRYEHVDPAYSSKALVTISRQKDSADFAVEVDEAILNVAIRALSGYIDLNTSNQKQLEHFLYHIGVAENLEVAASLTAWRRAGNRLLRVSDFYEFGDFTGEQKLVLANYTTLNSGRRFIDVNHSPKQLRLIMEGFDHASRHKSSSTFKIELRRGEERSFSLETSDGRNRRLKLLVR